MLTYMGTRHLLLCERFIPKPVECCRIIAVGYTYSIQKRLTSSLTVYYRRRWIKGEITSIQTNIKQNN